MRRPAANTRLPDTREAGSGRDGGGLQGEAPRAEPPGRGEADEAGGASGRGGAPAAVPAGSGDGGAAASSGHRRDLRGRPARGLPILLDGADRERQPGREAEGRAAGAAAGGGADREG